MNVMPKSFIYLCLLLKCSAFQISDVTSKPKYPKVGEDIILRCKTDGFYEYCNWRHKPDFCNFEWKFWSNSVVRQDCSERLASRMVFYHKSNPICAFKLTNFTVADFGIWTCEMESYELGVKRGIIRTKMIELIDQPSTTASTTTSTTTPPDLSSQPDLTTQEVLRNETEETSPSIIPVTTIDAVETSSINTEDEPEASSITGTVIFSSMGIILILILIIIAAILVRDERLQKAFGRRRFSTPEVSARGFAMTRLFDEDSFYYEDFREYNPSIPIANVPFH